MIMDGRRHVLRRLLILLAQPVCLVLLFVATAYAQSQTPSIRNIGGPLFGAAIAALICYRARRRAIGGWLLYYYIQLYGGALIIGIMTLASLSNYYPQNWPDKSLYTLFLLSTIPTDLASIVEIMVASCLLSKRFRNSSTINILRGVFVFAFIFSIIGICIDLGHWKESIPFDILGMLWPGIWFFYFTFSKRVNAVFRQNEWDYSKFSTQDQLTVEMEQVKSTFTPEQIKKYRRKATLYIVLSIIVLILGTPLVSWLGQDFKGLQTIAAIIVMAWGMGWYSISKGYSRSLGLLLGLLSWIGLIILYFLEDKNKHVTT